MNVNSERDLHYLLAVADGISPLILALERVEQLQRDQENTPTHIKPMLGTSEEMENLRRRISEAASARGNVFILGETGVGKELAARRVHG